MLAYLLDFTFIIIHVCISEAILYIQEKGTYPKEQLNGIFPTASCGVPVATKEVSASNPASTYGLQSSPNPAINMWVFNKT
jgi:hypothetical protein